MKKEITYYGIDVSKLTIQIALQLKDGSWKQIIIDNNIEAINAWLSTISISESWFIFEYTGTYSQRLAYCLSLQEANFSILNPNQSKGFSLTLKKTSKTDKEDAHLLALYGQKMQPLATTLPDENLQQKRQKYKHLTALKVDKQAFMNRLHALSYDPNADQMVVKSTQEIIDFLECQIQIILTEIFTIDDQEFKRIENLMTQVVGIGKASASTLIIATNGFEGFQSAKQISKFIGTAPTDKQSGTSVKGKGSINKSGLSYVRSTLYLAAISASRFNNACKRLFVRLRAKGKPFKVAIIAVINKLIKQLFVVVKNNLTFDNNLGLLTK
jgi:transposase